MRRKEIIAAIVVGLVCLVGVLGQVIVRQYQDAQAEREHEDRLAATQTYDMGDTFTYSARASPDNDQGSGLSEEFTGTLSMRVETATLYRDSEQAALDSAWNPKSYHENSYFSQEMRTIDSFNLCVYALTIKNIDAVAQTQTRAGNVLFFLGGIAHLSPSNEIVYCDPNLGGDAMGYFSLEPGEERRFVVGCVVRKNDADEGSFTVSPADGLGYRVRLEVHDVRQEGTT